jgi:hypothetical protein
VSSLAGPTGTAVGRLDDYLQYTEGLQARVLGAGDVAAMTRPDLRSLTSAVAQRQLVRRKGECLFAPTSDLAPLALLRWPEQAYSQQDRLVRWS